MPTFGLWLGARLRGPMARPHFVLQEVACCGPRGAIALTFPQAGERQLLLSMVVPAAGAGTFGTVAIQRGGYL